MIQVGQRPPSPSRFEKRQRRLPLPILLLLSPAMAFALSFPTIGYYTFQTYTSLAGIEGSGPAIAFRALMVLAVLTAFLWAAPFRSALPRQAIPGILFLVIYFYRLLENMLIQNVIISPSNEFVLLNFFLNLVLPSIVLAALWRGFKTTDAQTILTVATICFAAAATFLVGRLTEQPDNTRLAFDKVNPIALAYVCSSFLLYYLCASQHNRRLMIEAALVAPILLFVTAKAQSRGMMIATAGSLVIYFALLRGGQRVVAITICAFVAVLATLTLDPRLFEIVISALNRVTDANDMSTAGRMNSFQGAWEQFLADPLFGRYVEEQRTNYYPHNIYLESLMAVGLLGTFPLFLHLLFSTISAVGVLRSKDLNWFWTLIALLYFREAIASAASGSIWVNNGFWITSFMLTAMWYGRRQDVQRAQAQFHRQLARAPLTRRY